MRPENRIQKGASAHTDVASAHFSRTMHCSPDPFQSAQS